MSNLIANTTKRCPRCRKELSVTAFGKNRAKPDGFQLHCRDCRAVHQRQYRERHPEKARELGRDNMRRRRAKDPEQLREYMRQWRAENAALVRATKAAWESENYDAVRAYSRRAQRRWKQKHPEKVKEQDLLRRARKRAASVGVVDLAALRSDSNGVCGLCSETLNWALDWPNPMSPSVDHIVPLALGGAHSQENLQWAHLLCNMRKNARFVS